MVTVDDLSPNRSLPGPMVVEVTDVDWNAGKSRRAEVSLVDTAGEPIGLVDYEGAEITINWKEKHRYRISQCWVQKGGGEYDLEFSPSKRTRIEPLGPAQKCTQLLVIGDTHVGRTEHPRTGEEIDPIGAFISAVEYGIEQEVNAIVHVGDIFHESATPVQAMLVNQRVFAPLEDAGIPFYYIQGNHKASPGEKILADRDDTVVFHLDTDGQTVGSDVCLFGIDHYSDGNLPWHNLEFPDPVSEPVTILLVHQTLKQLTGQSPGSVDLDRIHQRFDGRFDCIISGHHHDAKCKDWRGVPVMYTGATEKMSTNTNPTDRVAWLLTIKNGSVSYEQYDIP